MKTIVEFDQAWPLAPKAARIRMNREAERVRDARRVVGLHVVNDYKDWEREVAEPAIKATRYKFHQTIPVWHTVDGMRQVDAIAPNGDFVVIQYPLPAEVCVKHVMNIILDGKDPRSTPMYDKPDRRKGWERRHPR